MATEVTTRPFGGLHRFRDEMDDLFQRFLPEETLFGRWNGNVLLPMDVSEEKDHIVVRAEIPGMKPEDIDISISGDTVTVRGEKKFEKKEEGEGYLRQERRFGSFTRTLTLPVHVKSDKADAQYDNGVLVLRLAKSEESKTQKIKVKSR